MIKSILKSPVTVFLLCAVLLFGLLPQNVSALRTDAGEGTADASLRTAATSEPDRSENGPETAEVAGSAIIVSNAVGTGVGEPDYRLGMTPPGCGKIEEDWDPGTRTVTLTAVPYSGCSFFYWSELRYDGGIDDTVGY